MAQLPTNVTTSSTGHVADSNQAYKKLNNSWQDVKADWSAVGDGTTNDTTAVQNAIDAANASKGTVYFPPGTYDVSNVTWKAGVTYLGVRGASILTIRTGAPYLGSCDSGSSSAFISDMTFRGLNFRGRIDTDTTFDQQRHLLNLNGVEDLIISECEFTGWHGDAIYLGSSNSAGVERHNKRVKIVNNIFDGLTKNNRNCISIIDGDDILIQGNSARRFSRNDMPGFVDVEPNAGNTAFGIVRNIRVIGNHAEDHNQNFFQLNLPTAMTTNPNTFIVTNNTDDAGASNTNTRFAFLAYARSGPIADSAADQNVLILNNTAKNVYSTLEIEGGVLGVVVRGNTFEDCVGAMLVGYWNNVVRNITIDSNTFLRCGATDGNVIRVNWANTVQIKDNIFHNCVANIMRFSDGESGTTSDNIDWLSNAITGTGATSLVTKSASHTTTTANNRRRLYRENGLSTTTLTTNFATAV